MACFAQMLPDGKRLHLNHGPIDLIIEAQGDLAEVQHAYESAQRRFATVLEELVGELPRLRSEVPFRGLKLKGAIAKSMERVVLHYWHLRVTPMAAVAGAVADEILRAMTSQAELNSAYVNNGGDIALHLSAGERFVVASVGGPIVIVGGDGVGGVATSGWRGRSFSLGIADSVTVLARTAAKADVAATLVANAVDLPGCGKIKRQPACEIAPDSDLRERLVTVDVAPLDEIEIASALETGVRVAHEFMRNGLIVSAALTLGNQTRYAAARKTTAIAAQREEHMHHG